MASHREAKAEAREATAGRSIELHKYHLVLKDGVERDVTGAEAMTRDGALIIYNKEGDPKVMYGHGQWQLCELESQDE
jgi:hypothetical protein